MIELITARGNTSLESAVTLTKSLRWDIQALGVRLSQAAADEEAARRKSSEAKSQVQRDMELKSIVADMRALLERIEDAVPLINLAITTSGVSLSTNLPPSISPSRLLQASTFLSAGDAQYSISTSKVTQVGPTFTVSLYMLFQGHAHTAQTEDTLRNTIWQEVIHKARVKLLRTELSRVESLPDLAANSNHHFNDRNGDNNADDFSEQSIPVERRSDEFAYQLLLVEDFDDDRVHTFDDDEQKPGRFDDVSQAGIREILPIHQISRIFYADTGKILNIGTEGEANTPVLLLKRDINAVPPRRMMKENEDGLHWNGQDDEEDTELPPDTPGDDWELEAQFARESPMPPDRSDATPTDQNDVTRQWSFPPGLDPEWIALEVYEEAEDSESETDEFAADAAVPGHPTTPDCPRQSSLDPTLSTALSSLHLTSHPHTPPRPNANHNHNHHTSSTLIPSATTTSLTRLTPPTQIQTSLSLLEMLIRLTSLQQFQQSSHLTINDELLNFFLEESSTTGAAPGDKEARKRIRMQARARVGFDPYDESPIKRRGELYQMQHGGGEWSNERERTMSPSLSSQSPARRANVGASSPAASASRNSTPLRQVARRNLERSHLQSPLAKSQNSFASLATPPGTIKPRRSFLADDDVGSPDELSRVDGGEDKPLQSVEDGFDE